MAKLKFNPKDSVIVVEAKMWGNFIATARLVFDTGASLVIIPRKLAISLGLKIDPQKTLKTTTASKVEYVPVVTIPKISVLGQEVKNVEALVKDLPPESGVDGLLGLSYIKNFKVTIDFQKSELELQPIHD